MIDKSIQFNINKHLINIVTRDGTTTISIEKSKKIIELESSSLEGVRALMLDIGYKKAFIDRVIARARHEMGFV